MVRSRRSNPLGNSEINENQGKSFDADWEVLDDRENTYRDTLGDGFEIVLGEGAKTPAAIVKGLNAHNIHGPKGQRWTEQLLVSELKRIGR